MILYQIKTIQNCIYYEMSFNAKSSLAEKDLDLRKFTKIDKWGTWCPGPGMIGTYVQDVEIDNKDYYLLRFGTDARTIFIEKSACKLATQEDLYAAYTSKL